MSLAGKRILLIGTNAKAKQVADLLLTGCAHCELQGCLRVSENEPMAVDADLCVGMYADLEQMVECLAVDTLFFVDNSVQLPDILILLSKSQYKHLSILGLVDTELQPIAGLPVHECCGLSYVCLSEHPMPLWQRIVKRAFDILFSLSALLCILPLLCVLCLLIGKSPIYTQERVGRRGKRFKIYKLRTMCLDAEKKGPQLSSQNDERITVIGRVLRKYRIDEFPQLFNVLKGDMSLIGPRPERWFYIKQLAQINPAFFLLLTIRPGITSLGMVKYGYASNVEMMLDRMNYEQYYYQHMTLRTELKILCATVTTILQGRGV